MSCKILFKTLFASYATCYRMGLAALFAGLILAAATVQAEEKTALRPPAGGSGQAPSEAIQSAFQNVVESVDQLLTIKDSELSDEEKTLLDIEVRKTALSRILDLSILEANDLKNKLKKLNMKDAPLSSVLDYSEIRDNFLNRLNGFLAYYDLTQETLNGSLDLEKIKNLAVDFKAWRETEYNPEVKKIMDFVLVFQIKASIKGSDRRLEKITVDLKKLESLKIMDVAKLRPPLEEATTAINMAREANSAANKLLLANLSGLYTAATSSATTTPSLTQEGITATSTLDTQTVLGITATSTATTTQTDLVAAEETTIQMLIEEGLAKIKEAYKKFIEISNLVKEGLI